jgi:hypothetical protein
MLPHLGHSRIDPIAAALRTASRARQVVQVMENSAFSTVPLRFSYRFPFQPGIGRTFTSWENMVRFLSGRAGVNGKAPQNGPPAPRGDPPAIVRRFGANVTRDPQSHPSIRENRRNYSPQ